MKKIIMVFISIVLLTACSLSNTPKSKVEAYLNQYNNLSDNVKLDLESKVSSENLSEENKDIYKEVLTKQYQDMKYEIKDESIDGDNATVKVKITVYDYYQAENITNQYMNENPNSFYDDNGLFSDDLFNNYKLNKMKDIKDTVEYEIEFYLSKKDGEWILENPDRVTLEKIHGLYNYTIDN